MLTDQDLLRLFQDPSFAGALSGVKNFKQFLYTDLGESVSVQRIYNVLKSLLNYIFMLRPIRKYPTRCQFYKDFSGVSYARSWLVVYNNSHSSC
jgi:hypothetical protein